MRVTNRLNIPATASAALHPPKPTDRLDYTGYGRLIQHCTDNRLIREAKHLHARLILTKVTPNNFLAAKLITFYAKSNLLYEARKVFDKIPHRNIFTWNALLVGYSIQKRPFDTLKLFSSLLSSSSMTLAKPDGYTVTCVLKALSLVFLDLGTAERVHCFVVKNGFDLNVSVLNALIMYYSRCGCIDHARRLFDWMPVRDHVSWNSMIAGYSQSGFYGECKDLYLEMLGFEDLKPDEVTVVSVLQACAQSNDLVLGKQVHRFVIENDVRMDLAVCNSLIALYAKCGSLDYAKHLFEEMSERDEITYAALISGYMAHGSVDKAMILFQEMKNPGMSTWNAVISGQIQNNRYEGVVTLVREMQEFGIRPNSVTLSSILPAISYLSNLKAGKEIHAYSIKNSYYSNMYVVTAIIDTYSKLGFLTGARRLFDQSNARSVIIWTAMLSAYAAHGYVNEALDLFYDMINKDTKPDPVTFTAVLTACAHSGEVNEARKIFDCMLPQYGIQPSVEQYACMVGVLSRAMKLSEALEFINKMPIKPSARVWGALLNGASISGNVEVGKFACDHLFEMEPENTGNYVIMANLYSQAGRWDEAENVRERLNSVGLKKIPGSSWIETPAGLQSFIAKDVSNEKTEEIYAIMGGLLDLMKEEGSFLMDEYDVVSGCE